MWVQAFELLVRSDPRRVIRDSHEEARVMSRVMLALRLDSYFGWFERNGMVHIAATLHAPYAIRIVYTDLRT